MCLARYFGVYGRDGRLLSYDGNRDEEIVYIRKPTEFVKGEGTEFVKGEGTLFDIRASFQQEVKWLIDDLYDRFGIEVSDKHKITGDFDPKSIKELLERSTLIRGKREDLPDWLRNYEEVNRNLDRVIRLLNGVCWVQTANLALLYLSMFTTIFSLSNASSESFKNKYSYWSYRVKIPKFTAQPPQAQDKQASSSGLTQEQVVLLELDSQGKESSLSSHPDAKAFKNRVLHSKSKDPLFLFEITTKTKKELRKAYKFLAVKIHPDKLGEGNPYATPLFTSLKAAYDEAIDENRSSR